MPIPVLFALYVSAAPAAVLTAAPAILKIPTAPIALAALSTPATLVILARPFFSSVLLLPPSVPSALPVPQVLKLSLSSISLFLS